MGSRHVALALVAAASLLPAAAPVRPIAQVETGRVAGAEDDGAVTFRGIPYAAAPTGDRRWRPPAPAAAWQGVRDGSRYGAACPQPADHKEPWAHVGPTSEDCLFLNVWRPARPGTYPVMVFLHGGGFTYGAAGVPLYDGARLAKRGVVVVTLNYRLGRLGFFAHPALTRDQPGAPLGNYGIMDQIAALRWVRRNAAAFGGDARNVTVFGESAGAGVVQTLMGSPAAAGLFQKAISESGAGGAVLAPINGAPISAEALGDRWAASVGLPNATAVQLRALPVEKTLGRSFPFIDGRIVVASPGEPFDRGREMKVPLLIGANSHEATLPGNNEAAARRVLGTRYDEFRRAYAAARPDHSMQAAAVDLAEDALSILPSFSIAAMHMRNGSPAYAFYFDQVPANLRASSIGTPHGGELEYLFGYPDAGSAWDAADQAVSDTTSSAWVSFAKNGNPNVAATAHWPQVGTAAASNYMTISASPRSAVLSATRADVRAIALAASHSGWSLEK